MMETMHMTFFWGKDVELLFGRWPAGRLGMYILSLALVFALSLLHGWLGFCRWLARPAAPGPAPGYLPTLLHALRVGIGYLLMLSFNVGVLLVAVAGHAIGFLIFGSSSFGWHREEGEKHRPSGLPTNL